MRHDHRPQHGHRQEDVLRIHPRENQVEGGLVEVGLDQHRVHQVTQADGAQQDKDELLDRHDIPETRSSRRPRAPTPMAPRRRGRPNRTCSAIAAPSTSASAVATEAATAVTPNRAPGPGREMLTRRLGQTLARDDAQVGGDMLPEHQGKRAQRDHPEQFVPVSRAGRDVGGPVPGVNEPDGDQEPRAQIADDLPDAGVHGITSSGRLSSHVFADTCSRASFPR